MPLLVGEKDGTNNAELALLTKHNLPTSRLTFQRVYQVIADSSDQNEGQILSTIGIPFLYQKVGNAFCVKKSGQEIKTVKHPQTGVLTIFWEVTCSFDSNPDAEEAETTPTEKRPKIRWYSENEEEVLERDAVTNAPIITVPGEQILITHPVAIAILEIKRFEMFPFNPDTIFNYENHVNSQPFYNAPIGSALMASIEADETIVDGERYIAATYRIKFKIRKDSEGAIQPDTWKAQPLHQGTKYFPIHGAPAKVYTDENGNPTTINLNVDGTKLPTDFPPVFLSFNRFPLVDFNTLSLGPY